MFTLSDVMTSVEKAKMYHLKERAKKIPSYYQEKERQIKKAIEFNKILSTGVI